MPERVILMHRNQEGPVRRRGGEDARQASRCAGRSDPGVAVYSALIDTRGTPRLYASSCNAFFGMKVLRSTDLGKTFKETKSAPAFPKDDGRALANIWSLEPGDGKKDLWCGVEPASLFRSGDGGDSWEMVPGISNHEHARKWQPGNGGLCMHTILRDGNRVHLGISTGGHYLSEDGGETLQGLEQGRRRRLRARSLPRVRPVRAQDRRATRTRRAGSTCRTTAAGDGTDRGPRPDIGVLRSDDHGHTWRSIAEGAAVRLRLPDRRASRTTPTRST